MGYLTFYYQGCGIFETQFGTLVQLRIFKKKIKMEILHGIYKKDIEYLSVYFQGYRIGLFTPPPPPIQASPFLMHANEYVRSLLPLGNRTCFILSMRRGHAISREYHMIPGLCTMYSLW